MCFIIITGQGNEHDRGLARREGPHFILVLGSVDDWEPVWRCAGRVSSHVLEGTGHGSHSERVCGSVEEAEQAECVVVPSLRLLLTCDSLALFVLLTLVVAGIGHKIKSVNNPDQRVELVKEYVKKNFPSHTLFDYALAVERVTTAKKDTVCFIFRRLSLQCACSDHVCQCHSVCSSS
jgi:hypothetical protein